MKRCEGLFCTESLNGTPSSISQHLTGFPSLGSLCLVIITVCVFACVALCVSVCVCLKRNVGLFWSCLLQQPQQEMGVPFLMSARAVLCSFIHGSHDSPAVGPAALSFLGGAAVFEPTLNTMLIPSQIMSHVWSNHCHQRVFLSLSCSVLLLLLLFSGFH